MSIGRRWAKGAGGGLVALAGGIVGPALVLVLPLADLVAAALIGANALRARARRRTERAPETLPAT